MKLVKFKRADSNEIVYINPDAVAIILEEERKTTIVWFGGHRVIVEGGLEDVKDLLEND